MNVFELIWDSLKDYLDGETIMTIRQVSSCYSNCWANEIFTKNGSTLIGRIKPFSYDVLKGAKAGLRIGGENGLFEVIERVELDLIEATYIECSSKFILIPTLMMKNNPDGYFHHAYNSTIFAIKPFEDLLLFCKWIEWDPYLINKILDIECWDYTKADLQLFEYWWKLGFSKAHDYVTLSKRW